LFDLVIRATLIYAGWFLIRATDYNKNKLYSTK